MIFVTVGTHEQPFDRLIQHMDEWSGEGSISTSVVLQTGYTAYKPRYCKWSQFFSYEQMDSYMQSADVVITHGGPSSFLPVIRYGKTPVVVPRQKQFGEHVNNHQLEFAKLIEERFHNIIVVENIEDLKNILLCHMERLKEQTSYSESHNKQFCEEFRKLAEDLFRS